MWWTLLRPSVNLEAILIFSIAAFNFNPRSFSMRQWRTGANGIEIYPWKELPNELWNKRLIWFKINSGFKDKHCFVWANPDWFRNGRCCPRRRQNMLRPEQSWNWGGIKILLSVLFSTWKTRNHFFVCAKSIFCFQIRMPVSEIPVALRNTVAPVPANTHF